MSTTPFYDPPKVRRLAASGDPFWKGAAWILDQQDAAFTMARQSDAMGKALDAATTRRASFMSDKISMDEAREKVRGEQDKISGEVWFRAQMEHADLSRTAYRL